MAKCDRRCQRPKPRSGGIGNIPLTCAFVCRDDRIEPATLDPQGSDRVFAEVRLGLSEDWKRRDSMSHRLTETSSPGCPGLLFGVAASVPVCNVQAMRVDRGGVEFPRSIELQRWFVV
jgi:hypothetical protein